MARRQPGLLAPGQVGRDVLRLLGVSLLGAVLSQEGEALLGPYAVAMVIGAIVAALSALVSFVGLRGVKTENPKAA